MAFTTGTSTSSSAWGALSRPVLLADSITTISQGAAAPGSRLARLRAQVPKPGQASFFFYDAHFKSDAVKVLPGEYYVDNQDLLIMTTLGSCIAACLRAATARMRWSC